MDDGFGVCGCGKGLGYKAVEAEAVEGGGGATNIAWGFAIFFVKKGILVSKRYTGYFTVVLLSKKNRKLR